MVTIYIDLQLISEFYNINLDTLLEVKGQCHKIGDISKTGIQLDYSEWSYCFDKIETDEINIVANDFFERVGERKIMIQEYIKQTKCTVNIYFVLKNYEKEKIYFDLSNENIKRFAEINASLLFDGI